MALDLTGGMKSVDWRALILAIFFGYSLTCFPLILIFMRETIEGKDRAFQDLFLIREPYLIFSIIAFSSVGTLLSNHSEIDGYVATACALNVLFGVTMIGMFSFFPIVKSTDPTVASNIIDFGMFSWIISAFVFAGSHLKTKGPKEKSK